MNRMSLFQLFVSVLKQREGKMSADSAPPSGKGWKPGLGVHSFTNRLSEFPRIPFFLFLIKIY